MKRLENVMTVRLPQEDLRIIEEISKQEMAELKQDAFDVMSKIGK